jgi:hypothetical protein
MKERDALLDMIEDIIQFFSKGSSVYYRDNIKTTSFSKLKTEDGKVVKSDEKKEMASESDTVSFYNTFYSYKFSQSREMSNIATIAFRHKVEAMEEAMKLYKVVLRKAFFVGKEEK